MVTKSQPLAASAAASAAPAASLHATVSGHGRPVLLLHGLFGMGSNLGGVARALAPAWEVHQLDLPNHGRSPWCATMTLETLADAVHDYIERARLGAVCVLGHSLGGKVAMQLALSAPGQVAGLVAADIAPVSYAASHGRVFAAIEAVAALQPRSRNEAAACLRKHLTEESVVQFLLLSLQRADSGAYHWRFNAPVLRDSYAALLSAPDGAPWPGPALFLHGELSSYVDAEGRAAALRLFPAARFEEIAGTGHWLHAEKPDDFNTAVRHFLAGIDGVLPWS